MRAIWMGLFWLGLFSGTGSAVFAQTLSSSTASSQTAAAVVQASDPSGPIRDMDAVVVSGAQPGPGLWKVSRDGHVLWILGTLYPLPNRIDWKSDDVRSVLQVAEQVLETPGVKLGSNIGFFKGLTLMPSALKANRNPDDKLLKDMLPADLYARWLPLKQQYLGHDRGIEKKRPSAAAFELYEQALKQAGLGQKPVVSLVIDQALKQRKLERTSTTVEVPIEDPRAAIAEFRQEDMNDVDCFRLVLDCVQHDLPTMVERANAWSSGDIDQLRSLGSDNTQRSCVNAFSDTQAARKRGLDDLPQRVQAKWLATAEAALQKSTVSFATLPISELLKPDGYLSQLQARGYQVEAPE